MKSNFPLAGFLLISALLAQAAPLAAQFTPETEQPISISLQQCLLTVVEQNPEIQMARHEVEAATGRKLVLRSNAFPTITPLVYAGQQGERGAAPTQNFYITQVTIRQALFNMSVPPDWMRGPLVVTQARYELYNIINKKLRDARQAWIRAEAARENLEMRTQVLNLLKANVEETKKRLAEGLVGDNEVRRAEIQVLEVEPQLSTARSTMRTQLIDLAVLMSIDLGPERAAPEHKIQTGEELTLVQIDADVAESVPVALAQRPDLVALKTRHKAGELERQSLVAGYYPLVQFLASGEYVPQNALRNQNTTSVRAGDDTRSSEIRFGPYFNWAIYDGGVTLGATRVADGLLASNAALISKVELSVPKALAAIRIQNRAVIRQSEVLVTQLANATKVMDLVTGAVNAGVATQLDYAQARQAYLELKTNILLLRAQSNILAAEQDFVMGNYIQYTTDPAP